MFKIDMTDFGKFKKYTLVNSKTKESVSFVPDYGATVLDIILKKEKTLYSILDGYKTYDELLEGKSSKSNHLIPFANRINKGKYIFNNKNYQLEINKRHGHAIHGLIRYKKFNVKKLIISSKKISASLEYTYEQESEGYPFKIRINLTYELSEKGFSVKTKVKNIDDVKVPFSCGWHPYFKIEKLKTNEKTTSQNDINEFFLQIESTKLVELDKTNIPTGKIKNNYEFIKFKKIENQTLDTQFLITSKNKIAKTKILDKEKKLLLTFWQESGKRKYDYLMIYTPEHRKSVAIEPMTSMVDAFNNKKGLIVLKPNQSFIGKFGVYLR